MTNPVHRTILLFDIEQFGTRDDVEQAFLRRLLYDVVDATLLDAGIDETARLTADRGDSVMALIDAQASVPALVKTLLTETPALLHNKNRLIATSARMRLRIALSSGYVAIDDNGWVGSDLNHAVRLLDSDPLRDALKERTDDSVLCVSDAIYQGVVRHGPLGVRPDDFHRITVETKEGPTVAWLHGEPGPTGSAGSPAGSVPASNSPASQHNDIRINGDQYGQAGGTHHGDQHFDFTRPARDERR
ncbi:hypothetical protein SLINC_5030 [Streptomyces lincolnensis]|uniref:Uncharacterized protein n=1 Tax=Streptomyces lincolnensis TaxID=1915 RepID=A0A1B1MFA4_STRLN|nr:hypothetical protein [Streptomyces lincolnensis]ANS67254.1 hypothetical protein SLINC_5030 [Streptomyces lincolnensis]AXG56125.1 hypothetical protein SLCG_4970 [Streptomyces lincolnensis]QMV07409.1 hypothetical protein GJU35_18145 [Streptomyces lincolnensis]